jgi:hypothetical protein
MSLRRFAVLGPLAAACFTPLACSDTPSLDTSIEDGGADDASRPVFPPLDAAADAGDAAMGPDARPQRPVRGQRVVDLGVVRPGGEVAIDIPEGTLGFHILLEPEDPSDAFGIRDVVSPSGERVHEEFIPAGGAGPTSLPSLGGISAVAVPQSDSASANPPAPGVWTIRFGELEDFAPAGRPVRATARLQMGAPTGFVGGRLDLVVYVPDGLRVDGKTLDADSAAKDADIAERLDYFFDGLESLAGIDRGTVRFERTASDLRNVDSVETLARAFAASVGKPDERVLHLTFTQSIRLGADLSAWGIAPGIPGAVSRAGTPASGIILAIGQTPIEGDGFALLHEMGHFIGLNHTTEFRGGFRDPLADTPFCQGLSLDDRSSIASCPDRNNIMFPTFYASGGPFALSPSQVRVFRGSPVYQAYASAEEAPARTMRGGRDWRARAARSMTRSGRALSAVEQWLVGSLCPHGHGDAIAEVHARGDALLPDLRRAAGDADLPPLVRRQAQALLDAAAKR